MREVRATVEEYPRGSTLEELREHLARTHGFRVEGPYLDDGIVQGGPMGMEEARETHRLLHFEEERRRGEEADARLQEADDSDYGPDDGLDDYSRTHGGMYCRHGTYLGTPGGADLMCAACEGGW